MCHDQEVVVRTEAEARITRETLARAEALLEHFDADLYPICRMHPAIVRTLHRGLNSFVERLDDMLSRYQAG